MQQELNRFFLQMLDVVYQVTGRPAGGHQIAITLVAGAIVLWLAFRISRAVFGVPDRHWLLAASAIIAGLIVLLGSAAAMSNYVMPRIGGHWSKWIVYASPVVVWMIVGVPIQMKLLRATYIQMLLCFAVACGLSIAVANIAGIVGSSFIKKGKDSSSLRERSRNFENVLDGGWEKK